MTATTSEVRVFPELMAFLEEHGIPHEVLDGAVVVNPPTTFFHEDIGAELMARLRVAAPPELAVLGETFGFWYDPPSYVMADVTVARRADCVREGTYIAPLLVVELLSPSTSRRDLLGKKSLYAEAGVPQYWIVDPDEPALSVLTLVDGSYVETARIRGREALTITEPFPVTIRLKRGASSDHPEGGRLTPDRR